MTESNERHMTQLIFSIEAWLLIHHGNNDAKHLLKFLEGDCEHPYRVKEKCDLCGDEK